MTPLTLTFIGTVLFVTIPIIATLFDRDKQEEDDDKNSE